MSFITDTKVFAPGPIIQKGIQAMSNIELEMAPYFQRIRGRLECSKKRQERLLKTVYRAIEEFVTEHPEATHEEAEEFLGSPDEVALCLMELLDPVELEKEQKQKKIGILFTIGILAVALVVATIACFYLTRTQVEQAVVGKITIYAEGSTFP